MLLDPTSDPEFLYHRIKDYKKQFYTSTLFLTCTSIGIGYLTFPYSCKEIGLITTILMIFLACIVSLYFYNLILRVYNIKRIESYPSLINSVLGPRHCYISLIVISLRIFFVTSLYVFFCILKSDRTFWIYFG